nr:MAG TPA: hypothetical protein [Bacteriophage sp.]
MQKIEKQEGRYILRFDPPLNDELAGIVFSAQTIASWSALLGLENTEEAIAAIVNAKEPRDAYDPKTGRNAWTDAYDAIEAALDDSAPPSNLMAVDGSGRIEPNPLVAAYNKTRATLGLGLIKPPTPGAFFVLENNDSQPRAEIGSGIDTSCVDSSVVKKLESDADFQKELQDAAEGFYKSLMPQDRRN